MPCCGPIIPIGIGAIGGGGGGGSKTIQEIFKHTMSLMAVVI
jgi:hypothetical protein